MQQQPSTAQGNSHIQVAVRQLQQKIRKTHPELDKTSDAGSTPDEDVEVDRTSRLINDKIEMEVRKRVQDVAQTMAADQAHRLSLIDRAYRLSHGAEGATDKESKDRVPANVIEDSALHARL